LSKFFNPTSEDSEKVFWQVKYMTHRKNSWVSHFSVLLNGYLLSRAVRARRSQTYL